MTLDDAAIAALLRPVSVATVTGHSSTLSPLTVVSTAGRTPLATSWLWRGFVPNGGLTFLTGDGGYGKSLLTCSIAAELSHGRLEGSLFGTPSRTLIVSAEDALDEVIVPRLIAAGADRDWVKVLHVDDSRPLVPDLVDELGLKIEEHDIRLLVLDPVNAFLSGRIDTHVDAKVRIALRPLHDLAEQHKIAAIGVGHLNKAGGANYRARVNGSVAYVNAARSSLLFAPHPENPQQRVLAQGKSNWSEGTESRVYAFESVTVDEVIGTSEEKRFPALRLIGTTHLGADDLLVTVSPDEKSELDRAADFLRGELAFGAIPYNNIKVAADAEGISPATLKRAKAKAGVESRRKTSNPKSPWEWHLPLSDASPPAKAATVEHLSSHEPLSEPPDQAAQRGINATGAQLPGMSLCLPSLSDAEVMALMAQTDGDDVSTWPVELDAVRETAIAAYRRDRLGEGT